MCLSFNHQLFCFISSVPYNRRIIVHDLPWVVQFIIELGGADGPVFCHVVPPSLLSSFIFFLTTCITRKINRQKYSQHEDISTLKEPHTCIKTRTWVDNTTKVLQNTILRTTKCCSLFHGM